MLSVRQVRISRVRLSDEWKEMIPVDELLGCNGQKAVQAQHLLHINELYSIGLP